VRLQSLVHLAGIAAAIAPGRQIVVLGSSSLLASYPELGDPTGPLEASFDADLLIEGIDESLAEVVRESIGQGSVFQAREGYFADAAAAGGGRNFSARLGGTVGAVAGLRGGALPRSA